MYIFYKETLFNKKRVSVSINSYLFVWCAGGSKETGVFKKQIRRKQAFFNLNWLLKQILQRRAFFDLNLTSKLNFY